MKKSILLRLPQGLNLSKGLALSLQKIFQQNIMVVQHETSSVDLGACYERRKRSLYHAFLFIMRAIPLVSDSEPEVHQFLSWCLAESKPADNASLNAHQMALSKYITYLIEAIMFYWGPFYTQAIEWLEKAEQYVLLEQGRSDLATLSVIEVRNEKRVILQWEKQLPPCSPETLQELEIIRDNSEVDQMPAWFRLLPPYERQFLKTILQDSENASIEDLITFIPSGLSSIPALADFSEHHLLVLSEEGNLVKNFTKRITSGTPVTSDMEIQIGSLGDIHCLRNLRQVYHQVEGLAWSIQTVSHHMKFLSGYMPFSGLLFGTFLYLQLCKSLMDLKEEMPAMEVYFTNHPLTPQTDFLDSHLPLYEDGSAGDFEECSVFLEGVERRLTKNKTENSSLQKLKQQYQDLLYPLMKPLSYSIYYSRAMWLLSLENALFMQNDGISYGIYEHGKDKKALQIIHTNTILLYETFYGVWPSIQDLGSDRQDFNNLLAHLFQTKHFQALAEQSVPGRFGIRNVSRYWLPDTLEAIANLAGDKIFEVENRLALNYKMEVSIGEKKPSWDQQYMPCLVRSIQLSEENRLTLLAHLNDLVKDESLWILKKRYNPGIWQETLPVGVEDMRIILNSGLSAAERLANMYHLIITHPELFSRRTATTHIVYESLISLYNYPNDEFVIRKSMETLVKMKEDVSQFRMANSIHW